MLGKAVLPAFGGTPAVWLTCLLFFQVLLLGGYLYAYGLGRVRSPRAQAALHVLVLAAMFLWLPILPRGGFVAGSSDQPVGEILRQLLASVGGPFLALAATGPLLQSWFVRRWPGRSPYRLYALSNFGSLLALLGYPLFVEPALDLGQQARLWSAGLAVFAVACATWAWGVARKGAGATAPAGAADLPAAGAVTGGPSASGVAVPAARPPALDAWLWLALSTCGSALLLATTSQISQNVAAVPLLWVVPLALYLVTFILCFDHPRWCRRNVVAWLLAASLPGSALAVGFEHRLAISTQIVALCFTLFAGCMACHSELARLAPHPRWLTSFYLLIAAGGALGGVLVTIVAPRVFEVVLEYPAALAATCVTVLVARRRDTLLARRASRGRPARRLATALGALLLVAGLPAAASAGWRVLLDQRDVVAVTRNFYGVILVTQSERDEPARRRITMTHGTTLHGMQFTDPARRGVATAYYGPGSGVQLALDAQRRRLGRPLRVGVVGMGAGTLAAWAQRGDVMRFYEINPAVVELADRWFTFRQDAVARGAAVDVQLGDARRVLQEQLDAGQAQAFDVLVVDAFSSDAIPVHLLTEECFGLYRRHLAADGLLAMHVSNLFLELAPVVRRLADERGQPALYLIAQADAEAGTTGAEWVLVGEAAVLDAEPALAAAATPWAAAARAAPLWTDAHSSLWPVLR